MNPVPVFGMVIAFVFLFIFGFVVGYLYRSTHGEPQPTEGKRFPIWMDPEGKGKP